MCWFDAGVGNIRKRERLCTLLRIQYRLSIVSVTSESRPPSLGFG
jgi:hypothetical protein